MAIAVGNQASEGNRRGCFRLPFRKSPASSSSPSNNDTDDRRRRRNNSIADESNASHTNSSSSIVSVFARFLLPSWRRLKLDPSATLFFPYEPGKQVQSAITIKNTSKSHVAFKFQTTAPRSCFMRPPGAILAPGESIIATVFRFVEYAETSEGFIEHKSMVKYRIMSMKVKGPTEYTQEMFDEQKDQARVEQILQVVFLDTERPSPALEKLKRQLAEAAVQDSKKPPAYEGPSMIRKGLVVDEWKKRRDVYLARQQSEGLESI